MTIQDADPVSVLAVLGRYLCISIATFVLSGHAFATPDWVSIEDRGYWAYANSIRLHIERHWKRDDDAPIDCRVRLVQDKEGYIRSVRLVECNADQKQLDALELSIWRSSPLPLPKNPHYFERHLELIFAVD